MKTALHVAIAASLTILTGMTGSIAPAAAASRSACSVLTAARASGILGSAVTTLDRPNPVSAGSTTCLYINGARPIVQLALTVMQTTSAAEAAYRTTLQSASAHLNVVSRQKGNIVITDISMNGDSSKLAALLDAALKNL